MISLERGQIIESYGRHYTVQLSNGTLLEAKTRGKRSDVVCGDWVEIQCLNTEQAVIEQILPRMSLFRRSDNFKSKALASNITQILIVLAPSPAPNWSLIQRALLAGEEQHVQVALLFNKADLSYHHEIEDLLEQYQVIGYPVYRVSAMYYNDELHTVLQGQSSILVGQSGVGKSTLTNVLLGNQVARTGVLSQVQSGRHTTTHTKLYYLNDKTTLIDSPGLQVFGLNHLQITRLSEYFPEMRDLIGRCRFHNCTHRHEPNCAIKNAVEHGQVSEQRLALLRQITNELER